MHTRPEFSPFRQDRRDLVRKYRWYVALKIPVLALFIWLEPPTTFARAIELITWFGLSFVVITTMVVLLWLWHRRQDRIMRKLYSSY